MKTNIVVSTVRVNGYWYLRVKYDENDCRVRYQQSTGLKIDQSSRQVEQARRRVLAELYEINRMDEQCEKWDISPELRYQPVSEWLKRWLDDCRESIAESTLVRYTAVVRHACQFFDEKGLALCRVSPMAMEEYRDAMLACGYSARTIQMHFKLLQTAFTAACSYGLNRSNPICGVQLPRVERDIPRPYSAAEQQKLLEELKGTDLHLPVLLALLYGMRIGEICGLCWEDIDWEKKLLHVRHSAKRVHDESGRCRTICSDKLKTQSSFRSFPLHPEVEQLLRQRQPRRPSGPVMTARYGLPLHPERLGAQFRQFLREHDLRHIRFHDLRHPYVKHTTKIFSLRLMDFQAQAYPDARRKTRGACQLLRVGQSQSPVRPLCNRKQLSCLLPQSKMSWILYAISMRLSGYTSTRSISSSASSVVSASASKIALDASFRLSCRACSSCFCFACANTAA